MTVPEIKQSFIQILDFLFQYYPAYNVGGHVTSEKI